MRPRVVVSLVLASALVACGLSVTGIATTDGIDAGTVPSSSGLDGDVIRTDGGPAAPDSPSLPDATPPQADAGPAPKCMDVCVGTGASCRGEICVLIPTGGAKVTCPARVACEVTCATPDACTDGVDCSEAASCDIKCVGPNTCMSSVLRCGGKTCDVVCSGPSSCKAGVSCTADKCNVTCSGADACMNSVLDCGGKECDVICSGPSSCKAGVTCTASEKCDVACAGNDACMDKVLGCATQGSCKVACGTALPGSTNQCKAGVRCEAGKNCTVTCLGAETCRDNRLVANAGGLATVTCGSGPNCVAGVSVGGGSADVKCGDNTSCNQHIRCTALKCNAACSTSRRLCCGPQTNPCDSPGCDERTNFSDCD